MRTSSLLVAVLLFAACSEEDTDPPATMSDAGVTSSDGGTTAPNVTALAEAACAKQTTCCTQNEETEAECRAQITRVFAPLFTLEGMEIDEAAFARCVDRFRNMSCDEAAKYGGRPPVPLVCEQFYQGTRMIGQSCGGPSPYDRFFEDEQCVSGACASNICAERAQRGESCMEGACEDGLICYQGNCLEPENNGEDCSQYGYCAEPYACFGEPRTCGTPRTIAVGETCELGTRCELGEGQCWCPLGQEGCITGVCGKPSHCRN